MNFETELISLIKEKKELASLSDSFVSTVLHRTTATFSLSKMDSYDSFEKFRRSALCKLLVTTSRKHLREVYGLFIKKPLQTCVSTLESLDSINNPLIDELLRYHQSTAERFDDYVVIYDLLFSTLHSMGLSKDYSLLDLACGYNPFAYKFFPTKPSNYLVVDLSPSDMFALNQFFSQTKISAKAFSFDILSTEFDSWISTISVDVCFLFKALDSFETVRKNSSKKLLSSIKTSFFVVSFALSTIGGRNHISEKKRSWFDRFCKTNNWSLKTIQTANEIFYLVKKGNS